MPSKRGVARPGKSATVNTITGAHFHGAAIFAEAAIVHAELLANAPINCQGVGAFPNR
jgi:hypothetical protein